MEQLIKILVGLSNQAKQVADGRAARKAIKEAIAANKATLKEQLKKVGKAGFAEWCKTNGIHPVVASAVRHAVWPTKIARFTIDARLGKALDSVVPANRDEAVAFVRSLYGWIEKNRPAADDKD